MMLQAVTRSVPRKLMMVVLATTFMALLVSAAAMVVYDVKTFQKTWVNDLVAQADILARASAPALAFNDAKAARENLELLKVRPQILVAAIYTPDGKLFAAYTNNEVVESNIPDAPEFSGVKIKTDELEVYHRIIENRQTVGTVYLRAHYELLDRLKNYLVILTAVMVGSMLIAALMSVWLQAAVTKPILAVTEVARKVMQQRDFSLRVQKTTQDEIGVLVDAFNGMLNEVGRRAEALEQSNRTLEHEMKERRSAEEALLVADRRKDEFLATLAHELRNPLAPLTNGLAILRIAGNDPAAAQKARDIMERQLKQMVRLVDDLLDVSRITTGKLTVKKARVELHAIVNNAVETTRSFLDARGHALTVELPPEPIYLDADATRLAQVFSNLLNNAAKYTNQGGQILFQASIGEAWIIVRVKDNGIGIAQEMLPEIFKMFTQVDYSLERSYAGLGVGLTLAKRLIELHDGTIDVQSEGLNNGSEFTVRLPLAPDAGDTPSSPSDDTAASGMMRYRILLADDNVDFAISLAALMRTSGHEVCITHDGAEALEAAPQFRPDFAFLDIGLPKLNGYSLARKLRELPATRNSILVAVTGWGQEKDRKRAKQAGFDDHLVKPVEPEQIQAILARGRIRVTR